MSSRTVQHPNCSFTFVILLKVLQNIKNEYELISIRKMKEIEDKAQTLRKEKK